MKYECAKTWPDIEESMSFTTKNVVYGWVVCVSFESRIHLLADSLRWGYCTIGAMKTCILRDPGSDMRLVCAETELCLSIGLSISGIPLPAQLSVLR